MPTHRRLLHSSPSRRIRSGSSSILLLLSLLLSACARFQHPPVEYVYVTARQQYLHDRVAAVSNRVGLVTNGEALEVVERGKRFVKVRTPKGEVGWIEDHAIIDDKLYAQFQALDKNHAQDPVVATGELRDDLYLHLLPGRETPHFLLVAGNSKVQLLARGTVAKAPAPGALPVPVAKAPAPGPAPSAAAGATGQPHQPGAPASSEALPSPAPLPIEDWWLVRDAAGHTGWLIARGLDVDVPDEVGEYAEGQRMIAAYPIAKVTDDGTGRESRKGAKSGKNTAKARQPAAESESAAPAPVSREITEYVTVLSPPRGGLPYDFDQIRVFTWSLNHHRYETAFRLHGVQGYLPVKISQETVNGVAYPTFSFAIANGPDVSIDPDTGVTRPVLPRTLSFRLEGNLVRRTGPDVAPIILTHDPEEAAKAKAAANKKRH